MREAPAAARSLNSFTRQMITLIRNGEVYTPDPVGRQSVLLADSKIAKVGTVDPRAVEALGVEHEIVDAAGCLVVPGFIDPHQHLLGGSGEEGFSSQTPEFFIPEIVRWGITTVVGVLGADTTMKTLAGLLARVKALKEQGLNAYMWTGGYNVPPNSMMQSVREDVMFIEEVIGAGEIAISDLRAMDPDPHLLAKIATDCYVGGKLSRKAGLTHFHVGEADTRLAPLRALLENHRVEPEWLYATHVQRNKKLLEQAVTLAKKGMAVDFDTVEEDLQKWLPVYLESGGPPDRLTLSSDAGVNSPRVLYEQVCRCVLHGGHPLEQVLPLVTRNTAGILKLAEKGTLEKGKMGDVLILRRDSLEVVHVLSRGRFVVRDGEPVVEEPWLDGSSREIHMVGEKVQ